MEIAKQATEACDRMSTEIGTELHDNLVQKLSIFRLYLDRLERSSNSQAEVEAIAIRMKGEFEQVIQAVRSLSHKLALIPGDTDSFNTTLKALCDNVQKNTTGNIHFENTGDCQKLSGNVEMHLQRITQELIHNAYKHSSAWHIWVRVKWRDRKLTLEVEDDGTDFMKIPELISNLRNKNNTLKMRTSAIRASINYSQGAKGLIVTVVYPLPAFS